MDFYIAFAIIGERLLETAMQIPAERNRMYEFK